MEALVLTLIGIALFLQLLSLWLAFVTLVEEEGESNALTAEMSQGLNGWLLAWLLLPGRGKVRWPLRWTRVVFGDATRPVNAPAAQFGSSGPRIGSRFFRGLSLFILAIAWYLAVLYDVPIWNVIVQACS